MLDELREWTPTVNENEFVLKGKLDKAGLRKILSLVDSPTTSGNAAIAKPKKEPQPGATPADPKMLMAEKTKAHFKEVNAMFGDLKKDMKDAANLAVTSTYFDRYAKRIERMPILDVDPAMIDYSSWVAGELRAAAGSVRTMGIRGNARESQVNYSDVDYNYAYGYRSGWYGSSAYAVPVDDGVGAVKAVGAERRKIRAEEKATAATDVHTIRANVIDATNKIRRAMTEKYRIEF
jgi:hypothetical protein